MLPAKDRRPIVFAAAAAGLAVIAPALLNGETLLPTGALWRVPPWNALLAPRPGQGLLVDQLLYLAPWREFLRQELLAGRFPSWNPFILGGVPFAGCVQAAPFYPLNIGLFFLPAGAFSLAAAFLKIFCAGLFTGLHLRRLGSSDRGAAIGALTFALGGFMIAWLGHPHANVACLLPALFWSLGRLSDEPRPRQAAIFSVICGAASLGGHPPTMLHVFAATAAYALCLGPRPRFLLLAAAGAAAGAALAAPALLPYLEYHALSSTAAASSGLARWSTRLSWWELAHLLMPLASGSPALGAEVLGGVLGLGPDSNFIERAAWTGVIPLSFAALAVLRRRADREILFHAGLAALGLAGALGVWPLPWLWRALPVFSSINPTRLLLFWSFGVATLAGLGAELGAGDARLTRALLIAAGLAGSLYWLKVWLVIDELRYVEGTFAVAVMGLLFAECWSAVRALEPSRRANAAGLTALFLLIPALGVNPSAPASTFYPSTPALDALKQAAGEGRAFALGRAVEPDLGMPLRLRDARGRDFVTPRRYEELVAGAAGDFNFYSAAEALPPNPELLAIGAVAATDKTLGSVPASWKNAHSGALHVFRPPSPARRVLFVPEARSAPAAEVLSAVRTPGFSPSKYVLLDDGPAASFPRRAKGSARLVEDGTNSVTVEVDCDGPGWLLLLDGWFPGWEATVAGKPAPVRRADYAFRAVEVSAGKSVVRFDYRPAPLRLGLWIALGAAALLAVAWFA